MKYKSNKTSQDAACQSTECLEEEEEEEEEEAHQKKVHVEPVIQNTNEAVTLPCATWLASTMPPTRCIHQDPQHPRRDDIGMSDAQKTVSR
jgi:hypothetical protein